MPDEYHSNNPQSTSSPTSPSPPSILQLIDHLDTKKFAQRALWRINMAKAEFEGNEISDPVLQQVSERSERALRKTSILTSFEEDEHTHEL